MPPVRFAWLRPSAMRMRIRKYLSRTPLNPFAAQRSHQPPNPKEMVPMRKTLALCHHRGAVERLIADRTP